MKPSGFVARPPAPSDEIAKLLAILNRQKATILWITAVAFALGVLLPVAVREDLHVFDERDDRFPGRSASARPRHSKARSLSIRARWTARFCSSSRTTSWKRCLNTSISPTTRPFSIRRQAASDGSPARSGNSRPPPQGRRAPRRRSGSRTFRPTSSGILTRRLQANVRVTRNARTYVLTIEYTDPNPAMARTIAAAFASAYLDDQLDSRFETSRRASTWIEDRIREIKQKADAAVKVAQEFRTRNRLTEASGRAHQRPVADRRQHAAFDGAQRTQFGSGEI